MKRVAVIADSHFDASPGGRFDECVRIHGWIADSLAEHEVDLILHAGDIFERRSTPVERNAVGTWLRRCADIAPVIIVYGNHDVPGDLDLFAQLRAKHPISVCSSAEVIDTAGCAVACLPWPRKANLLAQMPAASAEQTGAAASEALCDVLRGLGEEFDPSGSPRILLAHAMVTGSLTSTGQPLVGMDMEVGLDDLALAHADAVALGHIHMPQGWEYTQNARRAPVIYAGSPRRTSYGEVEDKSYLLLSFEGPGAPDVQRISTPCQQMVLIEAQWAPDQGLVTNGCENVVRPDADVRLRVLVAADQREAARVAASELRYKLLGSGAERVTVEEVVEPTATARDTTVAEAGTVADKLRALWRLRGKELPPGQAPRVLGRLAEIEAEVQV